MPDRGHILEAQQKRLFDDGSFIEANASTSSRIARKQLPEAAQVNRTVREYPRRSSPLIVACCFIP
jgi:hypothetical protein